MGASKKGRRKVKVRGREYLWSLSASNVSVPEQGFVEQRRTRELLILSSNKQFIVRYRHPHPDDPHAVLRVEGRHFPRQPGAKEVHVPRWKRDMKYPNPDFVRRLINWCLEEPNG